MNNWNENYSLPHGMGMMPNGPLLPLPPPMYSMPDIPPINPPPAMPMQLLNQTQLPDTTNQENENDNTSDTVMSDVSSRRMDKRRRSHERSSSQRRDRGKYPDEKTTHRSQERDYNRRDGHDRQDRNKSRNQRERRSKWDDGGKDASGPVGGTNMQGNIMTHSGMGQLQNMMTNNMIASNMMQNLPNMIMQQPMDQNQMPNMMAHMNMMNTMMPNMIDQSMMMNQQMLTMANQPIFVSAGVIIPPVPGAQTPAKREKPKGCRTVIVGGLPIGVTVDIINEIFERFGLIDDVKSPKNGAFYVRFQRPQSVEQSFVLSGYRFKFHNQMDNESTTIFVDYALNRDDQSEYEKEQRHREPTPPRVEPFSTSALATLSEKIKLEDEFPNYAPTLAAWLERGECSKRNSNTFYSLIQVSNNQIRRLFNEKMQLDDEFQSMRTNYRDKFAHVLLQLEQVAKILSVAKHQRVSDHFTKQQRRNIDMWLKMTEEVENMKEEFHSTFDEDETEKSGKNVISLEKYEQLKVENENLTYELEGYKNEAHLAKDEAERKFEKFKAHFIAQQALQNKSQTFTPISNPSPAKPQPPLPESDSHKTTAPVPPSEAKLISMLTAFLMVHPLGASIDYLTSYVKSLAPNVAQIDVQNILQKYEDVFQCKVTGVGASIDHRWFFATFVAIKESQ